MGFDKILANQVGTVESDLDNIGSVGQNDIGDIDSLWEEHIFSLQNRYPIEFHSCISVQAIESQYSSRRG